MGEKLTGQNLDPTAAISITKSGDNKKFKGELLAAGREVGKGAFKYNVYEFKVIDTDMNASIKVDGEYKDTDIHEGETVCIFAPTVLKRALDRASVGDIITITYLGKKKGKKGNSFHDFDVERD